MDIIRLYRDFSIEYHTEGHKHCRPGYVNVICPFCTGNFGYHLSYNLQDDYFICWRCGWHPHVKTLCELLEMSQYEVIPILHQYEVSRIILSFKEKEKHPFKYPSNTEPLLESHKKYLKNRGFNPKKLEKLWNLKSVGPIGNLNNIPYKHRIVIPFVWNIEIVSFDTRDVTDKHKNKYQACPAEYEILNHKHILYGNQEAWGKTGICVEGPTDVWRFGENSFAVSGIKYTYAQIRLMSTIFKRVFVVFDDEPQAQLQARKLVAELKYRGIRAKNIRIKGDPGSISQKKANKFVKEL